MSGFKDAVKQRLTIVGVEVHRAGRARAREALLSARAEQYASPDLRRVLDGVPNTPGRFALLTQLVGTGFTEGVHLVARLHRALACEGDVCEFGVGSGATSALIANEIRDGQKTLWLFDTFEGLPQPTAKDLLIDDIDGLGSMQAYAGKMRHGASEVLARLADVRFPDARVRVVPGLVEETIRRGALPPAVCFAYIDFDFYQPIKAALDAVWPRMPIGGQIVVDDYGFFSAGAKTAVDEFIAEHPDEITAEPMDDGSAKYILLARRA